MKANRKTKIKLLFWCTSITVVLSVGMFYFPREYEGMRFWKTLYFTLRLFVFEHDSEYFPKSWPLVFIHFAAPAITISAVGTAISYFLSLSPALKCRLLSGHVVICGVGRTGKLFANVLKSEKIPVSAIDLGPAEYFEEWSENCKIPIHFGSFHTHSVLERAGVKRARSIIFTSGDDLANLEGALTVYSLLRENKMDKSIRLIWAQIASEQLADTARFFVRTRGNVSIRFFDTYRIAAGRIIAQYFHREIRKSIRQVNLLGFGKFGRDLMEELIRDGGEDENLEIRVTDKNDREAEVLRLAGDLGVPDRVAFRRATIQDLDLHDEPDKAFFVCTDDDLGNLTAAMMLARRVNAGNIYVRMSYWPIPAVAERLSVNRGVTFVNINELVVQGIRELPGIFAPAGVSDLKRTEKM